MAIGQQLQRQERDLACIRVWHLVVGRRRSRSRRFRAKKGAIPTRQHWFWQCYQHFWKQQLFIRCQWIPTEFSIHYLVITSKQVVGPLSALDFEYPKAIKQTFLLLSNLFWVTLRKKHFKLQTYGLNSCFHLIKASWTSFSLRFWISQQ